MGYSWVILFGSSELDIASIAIDSSVIIYPPFLSPVDSPSQNVAYGGETPFVVDILSSVSTLNSVSLSFSGTILFPTTSTIDELSS